MDYKFKNKNIEIVHDMLLNIPNTAELHALFDQKCSEIDAKFDENPYFSQILELLSALEVEVEVKQALLEGMGCLISSPNPVEYASLRNPILKKIYSEVEIENKWLAFSNETQDWSTKDQASAEDTEECKKRILNLIKTLDVKISPDDKKEKIIEELHQLTSNPEAKKGFERETVWNLIFKIANKKENKTQLDSSPDAEKAKLTTYTKPVTQAQQNPSMSSRHILLPIPLISDFSDSVNTTKIGFFTLIINFISKKIKEIMSRKELKASIKEGYGESSDIKGVFFSRRNTLNQQNLDKENNRGVNLDSFERGTCKIPQTS